MTQLKDTDKSTGDLAPASCEISAEVHVAELLDQYSTAARAGTAPDPETFIARHPEHAKLLRECLDAYLILHHTADQIDAAVGRSELAAGESLGDYLIEREIGRGSMGVVYLARQESLRRNVALKVLSPLAWLGRSYTERFQREAMAAAALDHDHIVPVYQVDQIDGFRFYVMRWIDGCSLADWNNVQLPKRESRRDRDRRIALLLADAADALEAAHRVGIVHRDIKPSNLLLDTAGKIWISDFGLARMGPSSDLTCSGDLVGTLRYMSPEQATGRTDQVDGRSDVYALGATLYEIVSGVRVFADDDGLTLLQKIQSDEPAAIAKIDHGIDKDLATIIQRAMRPDRSHRYASSGALAADLRRFAAGEPIRAAPVTVSERLICWSTRHVAAVLVVLLFASLGFASMLIHNRLLADEQARTAAALRAAQEGYQETRKAVDHLGSEFASRLIDVPGAGEIRRDLLAETLAYYERFITISRDDPTLAADVARTRLEIARLIATLDSPEAADQAYAKAIKLLADDHSRASRCLWIQAVNERAMLRSDAGDHDSALGLLGQIRNIDPDSPPGPYLLALTHNHKALVHCRMGRTDVALKEMDLVLHLTSDSSQQKTTEVSPVRGLPDAMNNLAAILSESGRDLEAIRLARQSTALLAHDRSSDEAMRRSAIAQSNLATILSRAGKHEEANKSFRVSVQTLAQLLERSPSDWQKRCQLAVTQNNLGMTLVALHRNNEAAVTFRRAQSTLDPILQEHPSHPAAVRTAAGISHNLAILMRQSGRAVHSGTANSTGKRRLQLGASSSSGDTSDAETQNHL